MHLGSAHTHSHTHITPIQYNDSKGPLSNSTVYCHLQELATDSSWQPPGVVCVYASGEEFIEGGGAVYEIDRWQVGVVNRKIETSRDLAHTKKRRGKEKCLRASMHTLLPHACTQVCTHFRSSFSLSLPAITAHSLFPSKNHPTLQPATYTHIPCHT